MAKTAPFEKHSERLEQWFVHHDAAHVSVVLGVRAPLPARGLGLEVGVGSGRCAAPPGVGIDPSRHMLERAKGRGIMVACSVAEASLPATPRSCSPGRFITRIRLLMDSA